ncbi:MAG: magnesium transporter [Defluviitaleaceae bacterium]|nr:magnesium transporter [Defluviitaleaceae bacterium]
MIKKILEYIENKNLDALKAILTTAEEMEILHAYHDLSPKQQTLVFRMLQKDTAMAVFELLDTDQQQHLIASFKEETTIEFVNEMAPDDRVRLLDEMPAGVAQRLIASLSPEERESTNVLMGYEEETAGRIMTTEFITLRRNMTVDEALDKVSVQAEDKETVYTLFVTDDAKKLEGVLTLKTLLIARGPTGRVISKTDGNTHISDIMSKSAISVPTDMDQEEVARILQELDLLAIPVVDSEGRVVGIVTIDDAVDVLEDEVTEDILDSAGLVDITGNESDRSELLVNGKLWAIWKVRLPILLITLAFGMFSGVIIGEFEASLESIAAVAIFIPLIMGMSGNVGTQSSTVFARGVALGHIDMKKFLKPFLKEVGIGLSIGIVIGAASGVISAIWQGEPMLGLAVGLSLIATVTTASLLGFLVPFVLIRFNVDQAAGSAPIITSIKDIVGLLMYFLFVNIFMGNML